MTRIALSIVLLIAILCSPALAPAATIGEQRTIRYHIPREAAAPDAGEAWRVGLRVRLVAMEGNACGWQIERVSLRRPSTAGRLCDEQWTDLKPQISTPDGLWWVIHANAEAPAVNDFLDTPPLAGLAAITAGSPPAELAYAISGLAGEAAASSGAVWTYDFTLAGEPEPEDEDDDVPVDADDDDDDVPMAVPGYDMNQDGHTDGQDLQAFFEACTLGCGFDLHADAPCLVATLLGQPCPSAETDCNSNGIPDASDIRLNTSADCDGDGVPDECQIAASALADRDGDGTLDSCESDCNANGWPDDADLANGTSTDCDGNGVPDECDIDCDGNGVPDACDVAADDPDGDGHVDPDCNGNGWPDACDFDCNGNGVPDECDLDPSDPDGDGEVWADCNGNAYPDVCDLALPAPLGSLDCNANGRPDECDIAECDGEPGCGDCNANGVPDSCDIVGGIVLDENGNGVPDECQPYVSEDGVGAQTDAALNAYQSWLLGQTWGTQSTLDGEEQFLLMVEKREEFGVSLEEPW